jgi:hypothetical protein
MLSAAENAARKCAELGGVPRKKLKQTMVVKWSGLGYEHCTWETWADISDDELIAAFYCLLKPSMRGWIIFIGDAVKKVLWYPERNKTCTQWQFKETLTLF